MHELGEGEKTQMLLEDFIVRQQKVSKSNYS